MELLSDELQKLVTKVAEQNGIQNFTVDTNKGVAKSGDGYIGVLEGLNITDKDSDKILSLVVKRTPESQNLRVQFPVRAAFLREIILYEELLPDYKSFQEGYNIPHPFNSVAKMYGSITDEFKELLLLRNLKEDGFKLCNRMEPMDSNHLNLVLVTYARFHAISLAMRRLEPEKFKRVISKIRNNIMQDFQGNNSMQDIDAASNMMSEEFFAPTLESVKDNPRLLNALDNIKQSTLDLFLSQLNMNDDEFCVIGHSDCWSANIMFKYEDKSNPNIPTEVNLIDWQMATLTHPLNDISYFFYINAGKEDLRNYIRYLNIYHTALCENLTAFGLNPKSFYPFEVLEEQWKTHSKFGFFMCLVMLQQSLSETKTHDFEKLANEGQDVFDMKLRKNVVSDLFKQRMYDLVEFLVDNQFL